MQRCRWGAGSPENPAYDTAEAGQVFCLLSIMAGDDRATGWADELQTAFDHHVVQSLQRPESEDTADGGSWAGPGAGINVVVVQEASDCGQFLSSVLNWFTGGPNLLVIGWSRSVLHSWRKRMRRL